MKFLTILFTALLALSAQASKYETIPTKKITDLNIRKLAGFAKNRVVTDGQYGNCGTSGSVVITERTEGEPRENTIKQVMWGRFTKSMSVDKSSKRGNYIEDAVAVLGGERQDEDDSRNHAILKNMLKNAVEESSNYLYTGGIEGEFDAAIGFIAIWDTANNEIVWFGNGYCE